MEKLLEELAHHDVMISDGAWGTFLLQMGLQQGECPESWNFSHKEKVKSIAQNYLNAGAKMVKTNSFGGSSFKLKSYKLEDKVFEINKAAAEISKEAAGNDHFVVGSMGPTGKIIMMGEVTSEELYQSFKEQAQGLEAGGADAILVETMSDIEEAVCAVKAAKENTSCTIICTMTFEKTVNGEFRSMFGISPTDMIIPLKEAGADMVGANCGNGMEGMIAITKEIRRADTKIPVVIHANAGLPVLEDGKTVFPESPKDMAGLLTKLVEAGANIIGGCCGTTPEHIKELVEATDEF